MFFPRAHTRQSEKAGSQDNDTNSTPSPLDGFEKMGSRGERRLGSHSELVRLGFSQRGDRRLCDLHFRKIVPIGSGAQI